MAPPFMIAEWENLDKVREMIKRKFPELLEDFDKNFVTGLTLVTWRRIRKKAPRKTGELKRGIIRYKVSNWEWEIASTAPHAFALEFGVTERRIGRGKTPHRKIKVRFPAKPYFFPIIRYQIKYLPVKVKKFLEGWRYKLELR